MPTTPSEIPFLAGGGRAAERIAAIDWDSHPLGPPAGWPQGLKTALSLVFNSPESMVLCWGRPLWFFHNDTYEKLLGPRAEWAMGSRFDQVWAEAIEQALPIIEDAMAGKSRRFNDLPWKLGADRGAADTWFTFSYSRILDADGDPAGLFVFTNETTAKVLADKRLAETVERQRRSLEQMPGFVAILSGPEHRFEFGNEAYGEISGQRDFLGRTVREVFPDIAGQGFFELLDRVYSTGEPFRARGMPLHLDRPDGDRFIDLLYDPIRDEAGAVVGIFVGGYDVTDLVRSREALATANAQLETRVASAVADLMATEESLRQAQKMEAVGQLTGGLAHDFNNLLAGISGALELMQTRIAQGRHADVDRYMTTAQGAVRRAAALTHRLLAFSRRQTLDPRPTDVNHLIVGMEELVRRTVAPSIGVEIVAAPDLWTALVDPPQLENALLNLCINARDAMPGGGVITVETANHVLDAQAAAANDLPQGEYLSLCVTDTGTGMSAEVMAKAFDPFFTTKPLGEGTGLGLSMIYGFAQQSGGQVRIRSQLGQGSALCVYLPRHLGEAEAPPEPLASPTGAHARPGETVLVVDDEPTVRLLVAEVLADLGYHAIEVSDAADALKILRSDARIDLLITDVGLPGGMNGRQLADAAAAGRPGLKTLFVTGYAQNALIGHERLGHGTAVLTKPFSVDALTLRIRDLLRGR